VSALGQVNTLNLTASSITLTETVYGDDREDNASNLTSSVTDSVICEFVYVKVDELDKSVDSMTLFPSPTSSTITIQLPKQSLNPVGIWVYDMMGRVVHEQSFVRKIDLGYLKTGTYLMVVETEEDRFRRVFLKR
jgi:hypothetical protein